MTSWLLEIFAGREGFAAELGRHVRLVVAASAVSVVLGVPLGVVAAGRGTAARVVTSAASVVQTIPSLALLACLVPLVGIGPVPALAALAAYSLLPVVRGTAAGIRTVPLETTDAADGLGFSPRQRLLRVELPLAAPAVFGGVRSAVVAAAGTATLAAFVGAGGLGVYINQGLALGDGKTVLLGAVPAAIVALVCDAVLAAAERLAARGRARAGAALVAGAAAAAVIPGARVAVPEETITVGSKNFTEQVILGEVLVRLVERCTDRPVDRKLGLGATTIVHDALVRGEVDVYPEYSGTALTSVLGLPVDRDPRRVEETVRRLYEERFGLVWGTSLGFDNTFAVAARPGFGARYGVTTLGGLAPVSRGLTLGAPSEFLGRADGFRGLVAAYGLTFSGVREMDIGLIYRAVAGGEVDLVTAFSTDGRLAEYGLETLTDDRGYFPPYRAAVVRRRDLAGRAPEVVRLFDGLGGTIDEDTMRAMNREVDGGAAPRDVAERFVDGLATGAPFEACRPGRGTVR